jgi:hypothetical protein
MESASLCSFWGMDHHAAPGSLLASFERHLRAQNRSERTVGNYLESARLAPGLLEAALDAASCNRVVANAELVRFDASDPMASEVGAGTFWQGTIDDVTGPPCRPCSTRSRPVGRPARRPV